jgi:hypothetical protein
LFERLSKQRGTKNTIKIIEPKIPKMVILSIPKKSACEGVSLKDYPFKTSTEARISNLRITRKESTGKGVAKCTYYSPI